MTRVTVNFCALVEDPTAFATVMLPVAAPLGTVAMIVRSLVTTTFVASTKPPLPSEKNTRVPLLKLCP